MTTRKIYIVGKLNDDAVGYIKNMHTMIKYADLVRRNNFSVFIPCLDFLSGLVLGDYDYEDYFQNNVPWMEAADAIYVLPNWPSSQGSIREIEHVVNLGIPVFYNLKDLIEWGKK